MDQHRWKEISRIVDTALNLDKDERQSYIREQCQGDSNLRHRVTELLQAIEESGAENFLEGSGAYPSNLAADLTSSPDTENVQPSLIGTTIGNYKITKLIGHGGMGSVFLAERADESYRQKVALKILRRGMDTPSNIARFKRERQILAKLNHPNIARLLDGGVTEDGLPYLVMEYVEGTPLYKYCDKNQLTVKERIGLFKSICKAVQHAHNNAIIHRDLKPSNILVTDKKQVKILDFGIGKLLEPEDPDTELFRTQTGARILTLGYAAPEQVKNGAITTATDSYVLGILLYELLAGAHPFDMQGDLKEIEHLIRNETPAKPSERYHQLEPEQQREVAQNRRLSKDKLLDTLEGDLNYITMKALRKKSSARYNTVREMLDDLKRMERNQPIVARNDTIQYQVSKFIKRHQKGLTIASGFLLLVISFTFFYTWRITQERNRAQREAQIAKQVSAFLTDMFRASNPYHNPEDTVTAASLLEHGEVRIGELADQPEVQAELLSVMGKANSELGRYKIADTLIHRSVTLRKEQFGRSSVEYALGLKVKGTLNRKMGNFNKAESLQQKALNTLKELEDPKQHQLAGILNNLGLVMDTKGNYKAADSLYNQSLQAYRKSTESTTQNIANVLNNWAGALRQLGKLNEAETRYQKALKIWQRIHHDIHPDLIAGFSDLATVLMQQSKTKKADSLYLKALRMSHQVYDGPHRSTAQILSNIGLLHGKAGNYQKAEKYMVKALNMRRKVLRDGHPKLAETLNNLARLYIEKRKFPKALPLLEDALAIDKEEYGPTHPYVAVDLGNLGRVEKNTGSLEKAEDFFEQSLVIFQQKLPPNHHRIGATLTELGEVLYLQKKLPSAEDTLRKALTIRQRSLDKGHWKIADTKTLLGACLIELEEYQESEQLLKSAHQTLQKKRGPSAKHTQQAEKNLAKLYRKWEKPDLAEQYDS